LPDTAEELLKPELGTFGKEWVRLWRGYRDRLTEIASDLRMYPEMAEVEKQRGLRPHPYMVEVFEARDESEACSTTSRPKPFSAQNGAAREARIELTFARPEPYEDALREVHRPKRPLAYTTAARKYVRPIQQLLNTSLIRRAKRVL
jgi:hypothetical protein